MVAHASADEALPDDGARPQQAGARVLAYAGALAPIGVALLIAGAAKAPWSGADLAMVFLTAVLISAVSFGLGPALLAAFAAAVSYNFFFLEPRHTFHIARPTDILTFGMFFLVALATGWLAGRVRDEARRAKEQAQAMSSLLKASRRLSASATEEAAALVLTDEISAAGGGAAVVLAAEGEGLRVLAGPPGLEELGEANTAAARRVWETGKASSPGAPAGSDWRFEPLHGLHGRVGVIGRRRAGSRTRDEDAELMTALIEQGAVALERARLASAAAENAALRRADELRSALLNSISHDFRTPLASMLGSATTLLDFEAQLKPAVKRDLLVSIGEDARRLNRYVGDLLDTGRLEGGALKPRSDWTDVREALNSAIARAPEMAAKRIVRDYSKDLSKVKIDRTLFEQAALNILENAAAYGPEEGRIEVAAHEDLSHVLVSIEDEGPGVPPQALATIFDRFQRLERPSDRGQGLGLGLSIAKGFIEAMGGRIAATSPVANGRGTRFLISLPKAVATPRDLF